MKASDGGPVELINGRKGRRKGEEERGERGDQKTGSPSGCESETVVVLHCGRLSVFLFAQILSRSCVPFLVSHGANNLKHCIVDQCHLLRDKLV